MITIYQIVDPRNGLVVYVGRTKNFKARQSQHKCWSSNAGVIRLMTEISGYGKQLLFEVIEEVEKSIAAEREQYWIEELRKTNPLFNRLPNQRYTTFHLPKRAAPRVRINVNFDLPERIYENEKFQARVTYSGIEDYIVKLIEKDLKMVDWVDS